MANLNATRNFLINTIPMSACVRTKEQQWRAQPWHGVVVKRRRGRGGSYFCCWFPRFGGAWCCSILCIVRPRGWWLSGGLLVGGKAGREGGRDCLACRRRSISMLLYIFSLLLPPLLPSHPLSRRATRRHLGKLQACDHHLLWVYLLWCFVSLHHSCRPPNVVRNAEVGK